MKSIYQSFIESDTKIIDNKIAKSINKETEKLCNNLQCKEVDIENIDLLIKQIQAKNEFIQNMFKENFAESEMKLYRKINDEERIAKNSIDFLSNRLLKKRIDKALEEMLSKAVKPLEISTIQDRKLFLGMLLNVKPKIVHPKQKEER